VQELAWASDASLALSDANVCQNLRFAGQRARPEKWPDPAGRLPGDSVLAASLTRAVKNLIHHFDRRDLRPNKVGLPRR